MDKSILQELIEVFREKNLKEHKEDNVNYNIFYVLRVWSKEVVLHSRMIVDLLNPEGYHGMGNKPLLLFRDQLKEAEINFSFDYNSLKKVQDEEPTDSKRRIDIYLQDNSGAIIAIENKIYASDQDTQLYDYKNHIGNNSLLLYLTLFGSLPSKVSTNGLKINEDYYCISYSSLILVWIEQMIKEKACHGVVREILIQYEAIIKYLIRNNMDDLKEILKSVNSQEDYDALSRMANTIMQAPSTIAVSFMIKLSKMLCDISWQQNNTSKIWIHLDKKDPTEGLSDWLKIEQEQGKIWAAFVVCQNNSEGSYMNLDPVRSNRFTEIAKHFGISIVKKNKYYWWWIDEADFTRDIVQKYALVFNNEESSLVNATARFVNDIVDYYNRLIE